MTNVALAGLFLPKVMIDQPRSIPHPSRIARAVRLPTIPVVVILSKLSSPPVAIPIVFREPLESARTNHRTFGYPPVPVDMQMEARFPTAGIDLKRCFGNKEADGVVTAILQFVA